MVQRLLRARIGYSRLPSNVDPSMASYTSSIRAQMASIEKNLTNVIAGIGEAGPEILREALEPTFEKSQTYVPVETGELKASGYLETRTVRGETIVEMGYGRSGSPPYAVYVHEMTDKYHRPPTRAKFLQAALEEDRDQIVSRIVAGYRSLTE